MTVRVLLFSSLRERVGAAELSVVLDEGATAEQLLARLAEQHPAIAAFRPYTRVAVNAAYAPPETRLRAGDEIALITPTSGG